MANKVFVPIYSTRNRAVAIDADARTVLPGTNVTFNTDPVTGDITINSTAGGSGTVTSVGLAAPLGFTVSGSPVTTTGTLTFSYTAGYVGYTTTEQTKLAGIAAGAEVNVNADWTAGSGDALILNKPTLGTVSALSYPGGTTLYLRADGTWVTPPTSSGTVTSVNITSTTGLTASGGPVTTSGSLIYTLSANLQAWHALATSAKQDASANLTAWSALATSAKENAITAGTTGQYWRGDKTWQTLDKAAVGLPNADNTSDANKPVSTAQATADNLRVLKAGDTMTGNLSITAAVDARTTWNGGSHSATAGVNTGVAFFGTTTNTPVDFYSNAVARGRIQATGALNWSYDFSANNITGRDFTASRGDGTGVIYLNAVQSRYLYYDGTSYIMPTDGLQVGGNINSSGGSVSDSVGNVRDISQNAQNANYTVVLLDRGKYLFSNDTSNYIWTIPPNSTTAFPVGSTITFMHDGTSGTKTVTQGAGVTLIRSLTTGNISLTAGQTLTVVKVGTDRWRAV